MDDDKASVGTTEATDPSIGGADVSRWDIPTRGSKRTFVTIAEYAKTRGELSELKERLNELREQVKAMNEK